MDFKEINFYSTPVPIVVVNKGTVEYNHYSCNFDVVLPFNQEDYDKIQRIPYILYFSWEEEYVTVTYHSGIEIVMSKDANCEMIIHNAKGYCLMIDIVEIFYIILRHMLVAARRQIL